MKRPTVCVMTRRMVPRGFDLGISSIGTSIWLGLQIWVGVFLTRECGCFESASLQIGARDCDLGGNAAAVGEPPVLEPRHYFGLTPVGFGGPAWLFAIPTAAPAAAVVPTITTALFFVSHFAGCPS